MKENQNRKQPVDFVAEAEKIMNAPYADAEQNSFTVLFKKRSPAMRFSAAQKKSEQTRRKSKASIDTVIQTILMICCVTLAGLVVYSIQF